MFSSLKRFDIHVKAVDGVNQQTLLGAVLTIVSTLLVLVLIFSEISYFLKVDVVSRMLTDKSVGVESVKLEFDLQFYDVACNRINFIQEVTRGTVHIHEPVVVEKFAVDDGVTLGCHVRGGILIDKVGGNFRFALQPSQNDGVPGMSSNYSHIVRHIEFSPTTGASAAERLPDLRDNLRDQVTSVPEGTGAYHYAIQVVPTQYKTLYGELSFMNQYSVQEKDIPLDVLQRVEPIQGVRLRDFQGIVFTYDFHPVVLYMEERRVRIVDFVSNLFGIVGGVITILTLVERLLHQSTKSLIGKKD